jgi:hypothetical protein
VTLAIYSLLKKAYQCHSESRGCGMRNLWSAATEEIRDSSLALRMTGFGHGRFLKTDSQSAEIEE